MHVVLHRCEEVEVEAEKKMITNNNHVRTMNNLQSNCCELKQRDHDIYNLQDMDTEKHQAKSPSPVRISRSNGLLKHLN